MKRDIISTLPNEVICEIFSFLPLKEAGRTTILSSRYRNIFRNIKNIHFQESDFVSQDDQRKSFIEFASHWVKSYPGTDLHAFSLTFSNPTDFPNHVQDLIMLALSYRATKLALDFHNPNWKTEENHEGVFDLPMHVYDYKGIESLKLFSCKFSVLGFQGFQSLKELSLGWVELRGDCLKTLLMCCPMLKSFSMEKCWSLDSQLDLTIPGVNFLVLDKCSFAPGLVYIDAPNLMVFGFKGKVDNFYFESRLSCLQEADIKIDFGVNPQFEECGQLLYDLMEHLCFAKVVTVNSHLLQVIPSGEEPLGLRNHLNVRHLTMEISLHPFEFYGIRFFLKSSPFLHTLTINIGSDTLLNDYSPPFKLEPADFWLKNLVMYKCLKKSLKVVEIKGFKGEKVYEFMFIQYLCCLGRVLEQMKIYVCDGGEDEAKRQSYIQRARWLQSNVKTLSPVVNISIY